MSNLNPQPVEPSSALVVARPDALKVLLEASTLLLASANADGVLSGIVELAQQVISADAYAVWRTHDGLKWRMLASHGLSPAYRTELHTQNSSAPMFQAVSDVEVDPSLSHFAEAYRAEGIRSMMVVPLQLQSRARESAHAATITFYWRAPRTFSDLDVAYALALGNLSAAALNLAELHQQYKREKTRLAFLAEASAVLASSLDYETTLQRVAHLAVPQIADWCTVHIVENGVPTKLVVAHADPAMLEFAQEYSARFPEKIRDDRGLGLVLRTGQTEVYPHITDEMLVAAIADPEQLAMVRKLKMASSILIPLRGHNNKILGAIRLLAAGSDSSFDDDDVQLAEDLALRAAAAIENAKLHRAVLDQKDRLTLSHAAARMGTWHWDIVHQQMAWSDEFRLIHGLKFNSASTAGAGPGLIHPADRDKVLKDFESAIAGNEEYVTTEHRAIGGEGRVFWVHSRGRIERDPDGKAIAILGITMDVTERRQSEEAMRKSEKLAAAGRLAATVAHEINNPLESIVNLVYLSRHTPGVPPEAAAFLATADEELTRIAQIVRQTLGFYREAVDPRNSDICRIVSETCDVYRQRIQGRSIRCEMDLEKGLQAFVIPGELKQVVANLIANAIDATEAGGHIKISVKRVHDKVAIIVEDNGSGIEQEHLPRLFEPFFTTKAEIGTGLGLWVTKGIVDKQDGEISINSSTDPVRHGTSITVTLPLA
jgi:PAS domain S-box-containing protein